MRSFKLPLMLGSLLVLFVAGVLMATSVTYACACYIPPTPTPVPDCPLDSSGVVGDLPLATQADYAPGLTADGVILNPGTYIVGGIASDDAGNQYYRILLACQYLYVPVASMQPSYQAPQNGEPLPTTPVS